MKIIFNIIKKEFLQFKRDPRMFGIILIAPIIQLIFLGFAATYDVNVVHTLVLDYDKTVTSRELVKELTGSNIFSVDFYATGYNEITERINNGDVIFALVIPNDFEKKIHRRENVKLQAIFNGSDGNTASISAGYVASIVSSFSNNILVDFISKIGFKNNQTGKIIPQVRVWYNPTLKTRNFMVPAIVGLLLSIVTLILTSLAIVKEKEIGTYEQLIVTPIKPNQLIVGKLLPFAILGFISVIVVITAMSLIFNIQVRGNLAFLFFGSFMYILSTLGLGLFISTISHTQQQAMMLAIFAVMMPMVYLSGFAFPIENMPKVIQYISYFIPLRYFITIIRGVVLKGIGFAELWPQILALGILGSIILFLSTARYKKKLD